MPACFCLLNHELTARQTGELTGRFRAAHIRYPDDEIRRFWSNIPAELELNMGALDLITDWLSGARAGDLLIVQGDFGATFLMVNWALNHDLIPLYASTRRVAEERREGEKIYRQYIFEHIMFKRYTRI